MSKPFSDRDVTFGNARHPLEKDSEITQLRRAAKTPPDLDFMCKTLKKSTGDEASVVPALFVTVYASADRSVLGPRVREAIERYRTMIPENALRAAVVGDDVARLNDRRLAADLETLSNQGAPTAIHYASTPFGSPGGYGVRVAFGTPAEGSVVRFGFPWRAIDEDVEAFVARALSLVEGLPIDSGTIGFGLDYWHFDRFARDHVNALLGRYIGLEGSSVTPCAGMLGKAPSPSFVTLLGGALCEALGGHDGIIERLRGVSSSREGALLALRATEYPPLGDLDSGARDIGLLPGIARVLAPVLGEPAPFGGVAITLDEQTWSHRFYAHTVGPFRNRL